MDPDQNKTTDQNLPVPDTSNSYLENVNKPQTPAFNNTDYWNKTEDTSGKMAEPVNPPEPINSPEPITPPTPSEPVTVEPSPEPVTQIPPPNTDSSYAKWDDPSASTPPSTPAPNSSNTLKIVLAVVAIVLLSAAGLFAFQNYQSKYQVAVSPLPTPTLEAMATPDPYVDWKTYTDKDNKYSFKYPSDWTDAKLQGESVFSKNSDGTIDLRFDKGIYYANSSLDLYSSALTASVGGQIAKDTTTKKLTDFTVNNLQAVSLSQDSTKSTQEPPSYSYVYVITDNKFNYIFHFSGATQEVALAQIGVFDQIVSTFMLTAASPAPSGSPLSTTSCDKGYKVFTSTNYSLCYPETLKQTSAASDSATVVFDGANETLKVMQNFQGGWGGSPCLFIDKTSVAGYDSKRLSWKTEQASGGGCDNTYTSFAEMINEGNFKFPFPYALELTSKKTPFQDNVEFLTIEKSFQVTNPNPTPNGS